MLPQNTNSKLEPDLNDMSAAFIFIECGKANGLEISQRFLNDFNAETATQEDKDIVSSGIIDKCKSAYSENTQVMLDLLTLYVIYSKESEKSVRNKYIVDRSSSLLDVDWIYPFATFGTSVIPQFNDTHQFVTDHYNTDLLPSVLANVEVGAKADKAFARGFESDDAKIALLQEEELCRNNLRTAAMNFRNALQNRSKFFASAVDPASSVSVTPAVSPGEDGHKRYKR